MFYLPFRLLFALLDGLDDIGFLARTPRRVWRDQGFLMRLPFFYGWIIIAVTFVTMAIGVNARTAFSLLFPSSDGIAA